MHTLSLNDSSSINISDIKLKSTFPSVRNVKLIFNALFGLDIYKQVRNKGSSHYMGDNTEGGSMLKRIFKCPNELIVIH